MGTPSIREFGARDSVDELTSFLHRAYADLAARGLQYVASHQDVEATRARIARRECLIAEIEGRLVGTVTWWRSTYEHHPYYAQPHLALFGQFAVEPSLRKQGIGRALISEVARRARIGGASELACDTAEPATELIEFYQRLGFVVVARADWRPVVNYESVILSKPIA